MEHTIHIPINKALHTFHEYEDKWKHQNNISNLFNQNLPQQNNSTYKKYEVKYENHPLDALVTSINHCEYFLFILEKSLIVSLKLKKVSYASHWVFRGNK